MNTTTRSFCKPLALAQGQTQPQAQHPHSRSPSRTRSRVVLAAACLAIAVLSGCASSRKVDSEVRSFAGASPALAAATFRFERLPSQTKDAKQDQLEALAAPVLARKGLQLAGAQTVGASALSGSASANAIPSAANAAGAGSVAAGNAAATYTVQVRLDVAQLAPEPMSLWSSTLFSDRWVLAADGSLWQRVRRPVLDSVWYRNALQVVVRDAANGAAVYETTAVHESPWSDTINLVTPMLEAALRDYPTANATAQTITVVLPACAGSKAPTAPSPPSPP